MSERAVWMFGGGRADGGKDDGELLGNKGAHLAEMSRLGLPVPPGFTITTAACRHFIESASRFWDEAADEIAAGVAHLEAATGRRFGDPRDPLLLSVRSGARASMPGMMDTVLDLGLNDETVEGLARQSGDDRFAWDSYRRFVQLYGAVVLGVDRELFEARLEARKKARGVQDDTGLDAGDLRALVSDYEALVAERTGAPFPQAPEAQLRGAVEAVFGSWMGDRAVRYRRLNGIPDDWGTAVNVQAMVFGNLGADSGSGVAFTRDPATGAPDLVGEFLPNAQGEDVVAGIRTPRPLTCAAATRVSAAPMEESHPEAFRALAGHLRALESHYGDMQDVEFTVERGRLWILQTRTGKRTARAALRIAVDLVREGRIDERTALRRVEPKALETLLHPAFDPEAPREVVARGLAASPGAAVGRVVFTADDAEAWAERGEAVVLARPDTSPEDIHGMQAARGILTARGGLTSHAAVVARGMGRCCVAGAGELRIDPRARVITLPDGGVVREGDWLSLDGGTGEVVLGRLPTVAPEATPELEALLRWADDVRRLRVKANADTPRDAETARRLGAEGIGLCRTEHMFFDAERLPAMQQMIVADDEDGRRRALAKLLPFQRDDFAALLRAMDGLPVTIRLLDPPLHEFLPKSDEEIAEVAALAGVTEDRVRRRTAALHEANPMLGHRGCRLGISYPEIYEMQVQAILEATREVAATGGDPRPQIMIPLVGFASELAVLRAHIDALIAAADLPLAIPVGTMIELPRAALMADEIARHADFFSFGTNDLTQTALGISRDDAAGFLADYARRGVLDFDPFRTLDQDGVGRLVAIGAERGRATKPDLDIGICGEHGGDPASIAFCHRAGLDSVSCSPFRVPIARLAAARAAIDD